MPDSPLHCARLASVSERTLVSTAAARTGEDIPTRLYHSDHHRPHAVIRSQVPLGVASARNISVGMATTPCLPAQRADD